MNREEAMAKIQGLEEALAVERAKNDVLTEEILKLEDAVADNDVAEFGDVIANDERQKAFWRGRLLTNRAETREILGQMRERFKASGGEGGEAGGEGGAKAPLHNRGGRVAVAEKGAAGGDAARKAGALRNRATALAREKGISFGQAWALAEKEAEGK